MFFYEKKTTIRLPKRNLENQRMDVMKLSLKMEKLEDKQSDKENQQENDQE